IEVHLYSGDDEIPIIPKESAGKPNLSWSFILDKKRKISTIEATAMTPNADGVAGPVENGVMIWKKGGIRQAIELPEGSKEFIVTARNASTFEGGGNLDPHMSVFLDALVIGDIFIRRKDLAQYVFNSYTESGWHKFSVEFDNAMYDQKSGWDSNLFVKDIQIYELLGGACLAIRKGMENKLINAQYQIAYFRPLKEENNNQLLRFFKNRFKIESLRSIIMGGYNVNSLIREIEVAGLIKKAIFVPAPTKIKLKLKVPNEGIKLTFGFAIMEEAWDKSGDGVEFVVRLAGEGRLGGAQDIIFSRYINPKTNTQDRKWFNAEVDLVKFKGEDISLIFETRGSPASPISPAVDEAYDWAVWSE
ncbi:MAG: carbohydrate-binding domain-containing protein, partial [Candidatus Omnitrophica bacterium]|nr:carbohydrate-binding domain-containing protein [Candidatus Omnitrophota bacterium]